MNRPLKKIIAREGLAKLFKKIFFFPEKSISLEQYVQNRLAKGDANEQIRKDLLEDLDKGGRIFEEFKEAFKPTFAGSVNRFRDVGQLAETGISEIGRWETINSRKNLPCPECLALNGQVKTWKEWEELGLYKRGKIRPCKNKCVCILVSADAIPIEPT